MPAYAASTCNTLRGPADPRDPRDRVDDVVSRADRSDDRERPHAGGTVARDGTLEGVGGSCDAPHRSDANHVCLSDAERDAAFSTCEWRVLGE